LKRLEKQGDNKMNLDPSQNNRTNYKTGQKVRAKMLDEIRDGFVAKQLDDRHFLVRLGYPYQKTNPGKSWLKVCRDFAHQSVEEI
jgi:hypothetical protein